MSLYYPVAIQLGSRHLIWSGHRKQVRIGLLRAPQRLRGLRQTAKAIVIQLVGAGPRGATARGTPYIDRRSYRQGVALLGNVLMNRVVCESCQRASSAGNKQLDLIG